MQELWEQNVCLEQLLVASRGSKHKTPGKFLDPDKTALQADLCLVCHSVVVPPLPAVPPPPALPPPGFAIQLPAPAVTNSCAPLLASPPPLSITINLSGLLTNNPSVSTTSPSASTILPAPIHQLVAHFTPPAPPPATSPDVDDGRKLAQWKALTDRIDEVHLWKHEWWYEADYVPHYHFQQLTYICDIWTEWSTGLNGFLPLWHLNEGWGAKWQQGNCAQGTESCHHLHVVQLIEKLMAKPGWNLSLAPGPEILARKYEGTTTPHKLCDYIQKNNGAGLQEVLQAASHYPNWWCSSFIYLSLCSLLLTAETTSILHVKYTFYVCIYVLLTAEMLSCSQWPM